MLNPPISFLSDDLLSYIVGHVAGLPTQSGCLYNLSITDRAFTQFCQTHIFRTLHLGHGSGTKDVISTKLKTITEILDQNSMIANKVRVLRLSIAHEENGWLFNDPTLMSTFQLLAKSPMPPFEIHFGGFIFDPLIIETPILVVGRLLQSFFSQTLTTLHLTNWINVPLPMFLICPGLKEVLLDRVSVSEESYDAYPDTQCVGRESPSLEYFNYRSSQKLVKQMISPPSKFHMPVVVWSKLRVLVLSPYEKEEMTCLQSILNVACSALEELHLDRLPISQDEYFSLAGFVNLSNLSRLRAFALSATISDVQKPMVLHDINIVLGTIPILNQITNLSFDFITTVHNSHVGAKSPHGIVLTACYIWIATLPVVAFFTCLYVLLRRRTGGSRVPWFIFWAAIVQFIVSTLHIGICWRQVLDAFIWRGDKPGTSLAYFVEDPAKPTEAIDKALVFIESFLADSILTWRLYVVWGRKIYVCIIPLVITISYIITSSIGLAKLCQLPPTNRDFFVISQWFLFSLGLTLATHVLVTSLIVGKIWRQAWAIKRSGGETRHMAVIWMLLESGAIYSVTVVFFVIFAALRTQVYFARLTTSFKELVPTLIIVRVGLGLTSDLTTRNYDTALTTIHFHRATELGVDETVVDLGEASPRQTNRKVKQSVK